jgi:hypothetical protein
MDTSTEYLVKWDLPFWSENMGDCDAFRMQDCLFRFFESGSCSIAQAGLNSLFCLSLLSARIAGMCHNSTMGYNYLLSFLKTSLVLIILWLRGQKVMSWFSGDYSLDIIYVLLSPLVPGSFSCLSVSGLPSVVTAGFLRLFSSSVDCETSAGGCWRQSCR